MIVQEEDMEYEKMWNTLKDKLILSERYGNMAQQCIANAYLQLMEMIENGEDVDEFGSA